MAATSQQRKARLPREIFAHILQHSDKTTAVTFLTVSRSTTGPAIEALYRDLEVTSEASIKNLTALLSGTSSTIAARATLALRSIQGLHFRLKVVAVSQLVDPNSRHTRWTYEDTTRQVVNTMFSVELQGLGPIHKLSVDPVLTPGFGLTMGTFAQVTCLTLAVQQSFNGAQDSAKQLPLYRYVPNLRSLKIVFKAKSSIEQSTIASQSSGLMHLRNILLDFGPHFTATYAEAGHMHMMDAWSIARGYHRSCGMLLDSLLAPTCILPSLEYVRLLTPDHPFSNAAGVCKDAELLVVGRKPEVKLSFREEQ